MVELKPQPRAPEPRSLPSRLGCRPQSRRRIRRTCCLWRRALGTPLELTSSPVRLVRWGVVPPPGSAVPVPPGIWGRSPACSGSRCDLSPCVPAGHELDAHSASAGGGAVCSFPRSKGQTVPSQPLAASGGWRRGGSHFPGSWRVCVLPLVGVSVPPVTQRTQ